MSTNRMTFQDAATAVKNTLDILDVVGRYVALRRAGRNYTGLCPFHQEKTPSFYVNPEKQMYKCFGCGEGGDTLSFLMKQEHKTFGELISDLAEERGIDIIRDGNQQNRTSENELFYNLHSLARSFYETQLQASERVTTYLAERQIPSEWRVHFGLGYAPAGWENLAKHLKMQVADVNAMPQLLEKAGLANLRSDGVGLYDRFRDRLMIPIQDERGRVIAFGARSLSPEDVPKYLNSPETSIYIKSRILYAFNHAREAIRASKYAILMEGYFDVISAHMAGVNQAVGVCGTSLTEGHLKLLQRAGAETVYLCFDSDEAGQTAALRAVELVENQLLELGLNTRVIALPEGKDPDDFFKQNGQAAFMACLEQAEDFLSFKFNRTLATIKHLSLPEGRIEAVQKLAPMLAAIQQPVIRHEYVKLLSERLGLAEETLILEVKRLAHKNDSYQNKKSYETGAIFQNHERYKGRTKRSKMPFRQKPEDLSLFRRNLSEKIPLEEKEHHLLSYLFINEDGYQLVMNTLSQLDLQSEKARRLTQAIQQLDGQWETMEMLINRLTDSFRGLNEDDMVQFLAHRVIDTEKIQESYQASGKGEKAYASRDKLNRDIEDVLSTIETTRKRVSLESLAKDGRKLEQQEDDESALQVQLKLREQLLARRQKKSASQGNPILNPIEEEQGV